MSKENKKDWHQFKEKLESVEKIAEEEANEDEESGDAGGEAVLEHPNYSDLEEKLTLAEQKAHENWEKALRTAAELENFRRRAEDDLKKERLYGKSKLLTDFIPVLDSLELALQSTDKKTHKATYEGLSLTVKQFLDVLKKQGVEQLNPIGATFNPHEHEAVGMKADENVPPNTVLEVFRKGYKLNDRVIRSAQVIVAN